MDNQFYARRSAGAGEIIGRDTMNDLISRQAAIDALARMAREKFNLSDEFNHYLAGLMDGENAIRHLPSAQPERIKSKWALHTYMPHNKFCLACHNNSPYNKRWNFCPNCGVDMRGERDG